MENIKTMPTTSNNREIPTNYVTKYEHSITPHTNNNTRDNNKTGISNPTTSPDPGNVKGVSRDKKANHSPQDQELTDQYKSTIDVTTDNAPHNIDKIGASCPLYNRAHASTDDKPTSQPTTREYLQ